MKNKNKNIKISYLIDIKEYINGYEIINSQLGFDNKIYILLVDRIPERINDGMFVQTKTKEKFQYKILIVENENVIEVNLYNQQYNFSFVQPIKENRLLIVGARARFYKENKYDLNAKIFDFDGVLQKEIFLGDGIQNVQTTLEGDIWVSYFDEGVFGNFGWDNPVGKTGLNSFNSEGKLDYSNENADICDCYALNVINKNEIWFYYYSDFLLGKIEKEEITFYNPSISGATGFSKDNEYFLFDGGYNNRDKYILLLINKSGVFIKKCEISFKDEENIKINSRDIDFRGDKLILRNKTKLYSISISYLLNVLEKE